MQENLKTCLYCGEEIKKAALICKYCKSDCIRGDGAEEETIAQDTQSEEPNGNSLTTLFKIIALLGFLIFGYNIFLFFLYRESSCDHEQVIATLEHLYTKDYRHKDVSISYITTLNETSNTRSCSALMDTDRCKGFAVNYEVLIPDNRQGFTIQSEDQCALQERHEQTQRDLDALKREQEKIQKEFEEDLKNLNKQLNSPYKVFDLDK